MKEKQDKEKNSDLKYLKTEKRLKEGEMMKDRVKE